MKVLNTRLNSKYIFILKIFQLIFSSAYNVCGSYSLSIPFFVIFFHSACRKQILPPLVAINSISVNIILALSVGFYEPLPIHVGILYRSSTHSDSHHEFMCATTPSYPTSMFCCRLLSPWHLVFLSLLPNDP